LILAQKEGLPIDTSFRKTGIPDLGVSTSGSNNSLFQIPYLLVNLIKKPVNIEKLFLLLQQKDSPIDNSIAYYVLNCIKYKPGFNPQKWIDKIKENLKDKKEEKDLDKIENEINFWFNRKQYEIRDNKYHFPVKSVIGLFNDAGKNIKDEDLKWMLQEINKMLENKSVSETNIDELELENIIDQLMVEKSISLGPAQVGCLDLFREPGNIIDETPQFLWWNFVHSNDYPKPKNFTSSEEEILKQNANFYDKDKVAKLWYKKLCRPVYLTNEQLILFIPDKVNGEETMHHPLYDVLKARFDNIHEITLEVSLEDRTSFEKLSKFFNYPIHLKDLSERNDMQPVEFWNFDKEISVREKESYSSLEKLFYYPFEYVMTYIAGISDDRLPDTEAMILYMGNVSHRVVEILAENEDLLNLKGDQLKSKIEELAEEVINNEAIMLQYPVNRVTKDRFMSNLETAIPELQKHILENGYTKCVPEKKEVKGVQIRNGLCLQGRIDLVLSKKNGEKAIIDVKYSGQSKRTKEFEEERELQLVIYSLILDKETNEIPTAYFIIDHAVMLARTNIAFNNALVVGLDDDYKGIHERIKNEILLSYDLRKKEFKEGQIEVGIGFKENELHSELWKEENECVPLLKDSKKRKTGNPYTNYGNFYREQESQN